MNGSGKMNEENSEIELSDAIAVWAHNGKVDWDRKLWKKLKSVGLKIEKGICNKLNDQQILTFAAIFYPYLQRQILWDLFAAKYKLWDEICMLLMSRTKCYGQTEALEKEQQGLAEKLARIYIETAEEDFDNVYEFYEIFFRKIRGRLL